MEWGYFTFTGRGATAETAISLATEKAQEWLKSHQWRGPNNEPSYYFHHGKLAYFPTINQEDWFGPAFFYVISVYGPKEETAAVNE